MAGSAKKLLIFLCFQIDFSSKVEESRYRSETLFTTYGSSDLINKFKSLVAALCTLIFFTLSLLPRLKVGSRTKDVQNRIDLEKLAVMEQ
jgi:hypothetical protein